MKFRKKNQRIREVTEGENSMADSRKKKGNILPSPWILRGPPRRKRFTSITLGKKKVMTNHDWDQKKGS